jgi:hypothetical protein
MTSSDDDSKEPKQPKQPEGAKILDLRDRLPPVLFGEDEAGNLAVVICKAITERDTGDPVVWFAALMMSSFALQRLLLDGHKIPREKMRVIFENAQVMADQFHINVGIKGKPEGL